MSPAGEISDKGYINGHAALERHTAPVDRLQAGGADMIEIT